MSGSGKKLTLAQGQSLANKLVAALEPACERIVVAGSVRRKKMQIGDIELVCIPRLDQVTTTQQDLFGEAAGQKTTIIHHLNDRLSALLTLSPDHHPIFRSMADMSAAFQRYRRPAPLWDGEDVKRWGEKYKRFYLWYNDDLGAVAVDLFITTAAAWGAIMTIRTGPHDFSKALVNHIRYKTPYVQEDGHLRHKFSKIVVPVPTEEAYFRAVGVPYLQPEDRSLQRLRAVLAAPRRFTEARV